MTLWSRLFASSFVGMLTLLGCLAVTSVSFAQSDRVFTVATWGGEYAKAQTRALFQPFANTKNIEFDIVDYPGDPAAVDYQLQAQVLRWDVIDLEIHDAQELCGRNALERLDIILENIDPTHFVEGAITDCALGNVVWSTGIAFDPSWFEASNAPTLMQDFFSPEFKGQRAVPARPTHLLELATLASGIAAADMYDSLSTSAGFLLALDTIEGIKEQIEWVDDELAAMDLVNQAKASMALVPHILPARQDINGGLALEFLWDQHLVQMDSFAILRGTSFLDTANSFLIDSGLPDFQGTMSTLSLYGPTNLNALEFLSQSVLPWMPHAQQNRVGVVQMDMTWWDTPAGQAAAQQFNDWLDKQR